MRGEVLRRELRAPRVLEHPLAFANKAASIAIVVLFVLFWAQYLRPQTLGGNAGYVLVSGQSMEPRYHTGDLVLVLRRKSYHPAS